MKTSAGTWLLSATLAVGFGQANATARQGDLKITAVPATSKVEAGKTVLHFKGIVKNAARGRSGLASLTFQVARHRTELENLDVGAGRVLSGGDPASASPYAWFSDEKSLPDLAFQKGYEVPPGAAAGTKLCFDLVLYAELNFQLPSGPLPPGRSSSGPAPMPIATRCITVTQNASASRGQVRAGGGAGGNAAAYPASAGLPDRNTRVCKTSLWVEVEPDMSQFGPMDAKPEINQEKMNLDLTASSAKGNYVHCEYQSVGKDLSMTATSKCQEPVPVPGMPHSFKCDS